MFNLTWGDFFNWTFALSSGNERLLLVNPFYGTGHFLYPLKTSENLFSNVFRGYRKRSKV